MQKVSMLSQDQFAQRVRGEGIHLKTGAFSVSLQTSIPSVIEGIHLLYADYPLLEDDGFADFHVALERPQGLRQWLRPQVKFYSDGHSPFKPLPFDQAFPMFEWGMNWCVANRANTYLIIHAAVVERNDGLAAILPAPPGSGKSTLCAALVSRGWRLLSDELTLIRLSDGMLSPLPRPISLKNASIDIIQNYEPQSVISRAVLDTNKGTVAHMKAPQESVKRAGETAKPAWIVFPKYEAGAAVRLEPIAPARAFMRVAENAFNYSLLGAKGFDALAGVIDTTLSYDFAYSKLDDAIDVFSQLKPA